VATGLEWLWTAGKFILRGREYLPTATHGVMPVGKKTAQLPCPHMHR